MEALLNLLHMCDSLFPIGSFAHSDGLESATANQLVENVTDLEQWLLVGVDEGFGRLDGPAIAIGWAAMRTNDWESVIALDEEVGALRPSSAARAASRSMGSRMVHTWHELRPAAPLAQMMTLVRDGRLGPTLPVGFAAVTACSGIEVRDALAGYAYMRLAATVSAAMRLVAVGQTEAHRLLRRQLERVPAILDGILSRNARPECFAPAFDLAQMTQQYVRSRLFRS
jgi:urease accessory protein